MHIDKFMSMLKTQLLYFPKITVFNDKYEGELSDRSRTEVYKTNLLNDKNTPIEQDDVFRRKKKIWTSIQMESTKNRGYLFFIHLMRY